MNPDFAVELAQRALFVAVLIASPILLAALAIGVAVGMFQAATQINEQTMSFVPKLGVMVAVLFIMAPWMLSILTDFTHSLFMNIPVWVNG